MIKRRPIKGVAKGKTKRKRPTPEEVQAKLRMVQVEIEKARTAVAELAENIRRTEVLMKTMSYRDNYYYELIGQLKTAKLNHSTAVKRVEHLEAQLNE